VGDRIDLLDTASLAVGLDSVKLGEQVRIFASVTAPGRGEDYEHFIYDWVNAGLSLGYNPADFAGYFYPVEGDTTVVFTGLIFNPQVFMFRAWDMGALGCFSTDTTRIVVATLPEEEGGGFEFGRVPGAFSPHNQDGINDTFMEGVNEITILNRWGVVLYQAFGAEAKRGWDGRNGATNRMVDRGDYYYIISIVDENINKHTKTGIVTVF
jgi:gliding motility-associated-like protein